MASINYSLFTLVVCFFFKAPLCVLISFLNGLKVPSEAFLTAFQALADAFKGTFVYIFQMLLGILGSFFMAFLGYFVNNIDHVLECIGGGSAFGELLEKTKASWQGGSLLERLRETVKSVFEIVFDQLLKTTTSSAGGLFDFAKTTISRLLSEPGSAIGGLVETLEGGSSTKGVREIVGSFVEKIASTGLGVASSSTVGSFEILKSIFGLMVDSGYSVGGLVEKTRVALQVLRMEELRGIVESLGKILVNMIITYFLG